MGLIRCFITCTLSLALTSGVPVHAGWFGPNSKDECVEEFAKDAATDKLVRAVYGSCDRSFDRGLHSSSRAAALCIAEGIGELKSEKAYASLASKCARKHPPPSCPTGQVFNDRRNGCECDEMHGYVYLARDKKCQQICEPGYYISRQDGMCHLRFGG